MAAPPSTVGARCLFLAHSELAITRMNVCFEGKNGHDAGVTPFPLMTQSGLRRVGALLDFLNFVAPTSALGTEGVGVTSIALCTIKREIGLLHEDFRIATVFGRQSDADASAHRNLMAEHKMRFSERTLKPLD